MCKNSIQYSREDKLQVPDTPIIPFIEGDGVGPDIWRATHLVLDEAIRKAYSGSRKIDWLETLAGENAYRKFSTWLPQDTLEKIKTYRIAIKGPLSTPVGKGFRSLNVMLRQELDLYACIRPIKYIPGVPSPLRHPENVDMVVFRENTEDVYAGLEWEEGSSMAKRIIALVEQEECRQIRTDSGIGLKPISKFGTSRLVSMAIRYALEHNRRNLTLVHKGNIMKYTEGAFLNWGYETAQKHFGNFTMSETQVERDYQGKVPAGKLLIKDRITDAMFQQILLRPREYDVLAMPNLNGDYMSDALAAMVGGLGLAPGANIGDGYAVFEATHGTAPKHAGKDKINPSSLILSGAMMLDYMGWKEAAELVWKGLILSISKKSVTYDLARQMDNAVEIKCSKFAEVIAKNIQGI